MFNIARRDILIGGLTFGAAAAVGAPQAYAQPAPPIVPGLVELEQQHRARVGVYAVDLHSGRAVTHRSAERFAMCSTFKTYAAACVLQKSERGGLALTDTVVVAAADILPNSPITETRVGQTITYAELCAAALQRSDNAAANYLLHAIGGPTAITDFARSIGDTETRLDRWEPELNAAVPGDPRDTSTPKALGDGYRALITGSVLGLSERAQLVDWMTVNTTSSLRPGLPTGWTFTDKTGSGGFGSTNDIGVAFGPGGRQMVLAVMIRAMPDDPDAQGFRPLMAEIAALVTPVLIG